MIRTSLFHNEKMIYEPAEDSELLCKQIASYASLGMRALDMGTGSGVQAFELAKHTNRIVALDINPEAIEYCREKAAELDIECRIDFRESDMFASLTDEEIFDIIVFNPPYLPEDEDEPEDSRIVTTGGKVGNEIIIRFIREMGKHLKDDGTVLLLISTLSQVEDINDTIINEGYRYYEIDRLHLFFEELIVYEIKKEKD